MKKQSEQRRRARFRIPTLVQYKIVPNFIGDEFTNISDISLLGMAFLTQRAIAKGSCLELCFLDPNGEALTVKGLVVHCRKITKKPDSFRVGVCFEDVQVEALEWLGKAENFFLDEQKKEKD